MKKIALIILILTGNALVFAQSNAVIREMTGTVELKRAGSEDWVSANTGDRIEKATVLATGFRSTALLAIGNTTILVRPLTRLRLDEIISQQETETINISINSGRIRADVNPPSRGRTNFNAQSPSATASVRGTAFEMGTVNIQVQEGSVSYASTSGSRTNTVIVNAGQESSIVPGTGRALTPMEAAEIACPLPGFEEIESSRRLRMPSGGETSGAGYGYIGINIGLVER